MEIVVDKPVRNRIDSASYRETISALKTLGATEMDQSNGHNLDRFEMPNHKVITMSNSSRRPKAMHNWLFRKFLGEVEQAGVSTELFLALVEAGNGIAWMKQDPWIIHLARTYREHKHEFDLTVKSEQARLLRLAAEFYEAPALPPTDVPEGGELPPEPEPQASYTLIQALDVVLGPDPDNMRPLYYGRIKQNIYGRSGPAWKVIEPHLIKPSRPRKLPTLSEEGVYAIGAYVEEEEARRMSTLEPQTEILPQAPSTTTAAGEPWDRTEEPEAEEITVNENTSTPPEPATRRVQTGSFGHHPPFGQIQDDNNRRYPPIGAMGDPTRLIQATVKIGVEPTWDGYRLDVEATMWALVNRINEPDFRE